MIELLIDGIPVSAEEGSTILEAAKGAGIYIPSLCYLEGQAVKANCRICVVEVKGIKNPVPACATQVVSGMEVQTKSPAIIEERRRCLQLILTHHPIACQSCVRLGNSRHCDLSKELCKMCVYCDCVKDGDCELQRLIEEYDVNGMDYIWHEKERSMDDTARSFVKDPSKCIMCRRCVGACGEVQGVYTWSVTGRGCEADIKPAGAVSIAESPCVECGLCVRSCPVGALFEVQNLDDLPDAVQDYSRMVVARADSRFLAPYLRISKLQNEGMDSGNLSAGLRYFGVDVVIGNEQADQETFDALTKELDKRLAAKDTLPLITATCPSAVRYLKKHYPELVSHLSQVPGAQELFGRWAKETWGDGAYTLSLTSCSAKKMEAADSRAVDQVMSPRELSRLFDCSGVDLKRLPKKGVDENTDQIDNMAETGMAAGIRTREVKRGDKTIYMASAWGLRAVKQVLDQVRSGSKTYDYIELLACPDGCRSSEGLPFEALS